MQQQSFVALKTEGQNLDDIFKVNPFITKFIKPSQHEQFTRQEESHRSQLETPPDYANDSNLSG